MDNNPHSGHRGRVRKEFLACGYDDSTPAHKMLEHLLFYAIPRSDTNEISHRLIERFGDICGVLDAAPEDLAGVKGVGENAATLIKLILPIARRYGVEKSLGRLKFSSFDEIGEFIATQYVGFSNEKFGVLGLDTVGNKLFFKFMANGDISTVGVSVRDVVKAAIDSGASSVVLSHNHPSGTCFPSVADTEITKSLVNAMNTVGVRVLDHIIVGTNDFVSMRQSKDYASIFRPE